MDDSDMIYSMQMELSTGVSAHWILFEKFKVTTGLQLVYAMLFILALCLVTEGLSYYIWVIQ